MLLPQAEKSLAVQEVSPQGYGAGPRAQDWGKQPSHRAWGATRLGVPCAAGTGMHASCASPL